MIYLSHINPKIATYEKEISDRNAFIALSDLNFPQLLRVLRLTLTDSLHALQTSAKVASIAIRIKTPIGDKKASSEPINTNRPFV